MTSKSCLTSIIAFHICAVVLIAVTVSSDPVHRSKRMTELFGKRAAASEGATNDDDNDWQSKYRPWYRRSVPIWATYGLDENPMKFTGGSFRRPPLQKRLTELFGKRSGPEKRVSEMFG